MPQKYTSFRDWLKSRLIHPMAESIVIGIIIINAITLGLETDKVLFAKFGEILIDIDRACVTFYVIEIFFKIYAFRRDYFKDPWHIFDIIVVSVTFVPATGPFNIIRGLRILRLFRIVENFPRLRSIVRSLLISIPGMIGVVTLIFIILYIYGVMGTMFFGEKFPEFYGSLGKTLYSLFQAMTLESWSSQLARPVIAVYPWAWMYFVSFIAISALAVLNLIVGLLVSAIQEERDRMRDIKAESQRKETEETMLDAISDLNDRLKSLQRSHKLILEEQIEQTHTENKD
jgi:voltage-gated sodium channel